MSHDFTLSEGERQELLERFLRYAKISTPSDPASSTSPSTAVQFELSNLLAQELLALGCGDAAVDGHGQVFATVPGNLEPGNPSVPTVGLIAHVDTYFGVPTGDVRPQVIESYAGESIALPGVEGMSIDPADNPNLRRCVGHTLITTDGTTLLGADDKAGVAEIMTVVDWLLRHPEVPHGPVRVAFTTDEEIGRGTEGFDVGAFGADYAYTLDGSDLGDVEDETFCADSARVVIEGIDIHPGYAKDKMVNAIRVAAAIIGELPTDFLPETTSGREPFVHPCGLTGSIEKAEIATIVRAFTEEELEVRHQSLRDAVAATAVRFPRARISIEVEKSYRNMALRIAEDPKVLEHALEAVRRAGLEPRRRPIRGGTDGSQLSYKGLLTPNLFAGGQNIHSQREWVSLEWMSKAVETTLHLLQVWRERG